MAAEGLPAPVEDMREAILSAVRSGRIEELRHAWELNELKPDLGVASVGDPSRIGSRSRATAKAGRSWRRWPRSWTRATWCCRWGADIENNRLYVWPYFAEVPLDKLSPGQEVELLRLVPPAAAKDMRSAGKYTHWRIVIGADGTWHSFRRGP